MVLEPLIGRGWEAQVGQGQGGGRGGEAGSLHFSLKMAEKGLPVNQCICIYTDTMFTTAELFGKFHSPKAPLATARQQAAAAAPQELERLFASCLPAGLLLPSPEGRQQPGPGLQPARHLLDLPLADPQPGQFLPPSRAQGHGLVCLLGRPAVSTDDSPYCQARRRSGPRHLERASRASAQAAEQRSGQAWRFHGKETWG